MQPTEQEPDPTGYIALKQRLIDELCESLLVGRSSKSIVRCCDARILFCHVRCIGA
jgi:hypothetical protein